MVLNPYSWTKVKFFCMSFVVCIGTVTCFITKVESFEELLGCKYYFLGFARGYWIFVCQNPACFAIK